MSDDELAPYDYHLPADRIAQRPCEPRDAARLLVWRAGDRSIAHHRVTDLPRLLRAGDLLVMNRTRVLPARLPAERPGGGKAEILLVHRLPDDGRPGERWNCLVRGKVTPGTVLRIAGGTSATVERLDEDGSRELRFPGDCVVQDLAERHGHVPLPPYIQRPDSAADRDRYQTVYADSPGSVAAPTAGLHLTLRLLDDLQEQGIARTLVDLAVGPGTFRPVQVTALREHRMHAEHASCPDTAVADIAACRRDGGRVVAIGTTVVRTLESACDAAGALQAWQGWTRLFLHPPTRPRIADALLTNFHLPRSTLLMLVACYTGIPELQRIYRCAIEQDYRFYSYGDAMLVLP